jgi:hypothetical protein
MKQIKKEIIMAKLTKMEWIITSGIITAIASGFYWGGSIKTEVVNLRVDNGIIKEENQRDHFSIISKVEASQDKINNLENKVSVLESKK